MREIYYIIIFLLICFETVNAEPIFKKDSTSQLIEIFISDSSSTTGAGKTALVYNSTNLTAYYYCSGTTATSVTLATMTVCTWASGGFKEIDAANMPGWYQFGIPNNALASGCGADVNFHIFEKTTFALNVVPLPFAISLVDNLESDTYAKVNPLTYTVSNKVDANVYTWNGTAVATPDTAGYPVVTVKDGTGTGEINTASGLVDIPQAGADKAWGTAARVLTAGTNVALAKGTGVTGFNDLSAAQVNTEVDTALADYDPPTRAEATADKDAILATTPTTGVKAN